MANSVMDGFEPFFRDVSINPNIIQPNDADKEEKTRSRFVFIDSRDRDTEKFNINKYEIQFNEPFENVTSVDVIKVKIPFVNTNEPYIIMKISGMDLLQSNNNIINRSTAILYEHPDSTNINFQDSICKRFNPPKSVVNFKIAFYNYDGSLYDFETQEHSIVLKITTLKQGRRV